MHNKQPKGENKSEISLTLNVQNNKYQTREKYNLMEGVKKIIHLI